MPKPHDIFDKVRLTPGQLRAVAERRLADARCLLHSGDSERANGAVYLAGFVIECLLKALLLERHRNLGGKVDPAKLSKSDRDVYGMLYGHDLAEMLMYLPELRTKLADARLRSGRSAWRGVQTICEQWTIYARYSPRQIKPNQAKEFLETVEEVKKWLKTL